MQSKRENYEVGQPEDPAPAAGGGDGLRAGVAVVDITPPVGVDLCGFAMRRGASVGVHDHLFSKALFLDDGVRAAVLCANDLIGLNEETCAQVRAHLPQGDPRFLDAQLTATHTHSGPATILLRSCGAMDPAYMQELQGKLAGCMAAAPGAARRVRVRVGESRVRLNFNRRDPDAGVADDALTILSFYDVGKIQFDSTAKIGQVLVSLVSYPCHPVVMGHGNRYVSGDYAGYLQAAVERETGAPCLFLLGPCGDVDPVVRNSTEIAEAREMGERLAAAAIASLADGRDHSDSRLNLHEAAIDVPVEVPSSPEALAQQVADLETRFGVPPEIFADRVALLQQQLADGSFARSVRIKLTLLALSRDLAILFVPGEMFAGTGLAIKGRSPYSTTIIATMANGSLGYLPSSESYASGGYEPYLASWFYDGPMFTSELEQMLIEAAEGLLNA